MATALEIKLLEKHWLKRVVWRTTSATAIFACVLTAWHFHGLQDIRSWLIIGAFALLQVFANYYIAEFRLFGTALFYGSAFLTLNFIGPLLPVENGLVYIYPLLAISAIVTLRDRVRLYSVIIAGLCSFLLYMWIEGASVLNPDVIANPELNFICATISLSAGLLAILGYSKMWKAKQVKISQKYAELKSFVNFVNESPLPLMRINTEGDILLTNSSAKALLAREDGSGINYPPGCSQVVIDAFQSNESRTLKTKSNGKTLQLVITPNRERGYVNLYGEDITEMEKAAEKVYELRNAVDQLADGVAIYNKEGNYEYVNASFATILGYGHSGQLVDKNWAVITSKAWNDQFAENIAPNLQLERVWRGEAACVKLDGSHLDGYITLTKVPNGKTVVYLRDYTEIKTYQNDLIDAKELAEEAAKAKAEFLATMSHEIRTPMNGVLGMASLLADTDLNVTQKEYLETILYSGDQLMSIINEILDFSKLEAGKMELNESRIHPVVLVEKALQMATHQASMQNNLLTSHVDHKVPRTIMADGPRLMQIINNLINNALKFTQNGKVHIELSAEKGSEFREHIICISITDSGIGIAKEKLRELFDAFTQADSSTTRQYGGTGLGLSICKRLSEMMGGFIEVESELGEGSTFTLKFPALSIPNDDGREEEFQYRHFDSKLGETYPLKVLVAEDNFINQRLAEQVFRSMGYEIDLAENGVLALEACKKEHYDIVFMDIHMPEMDGIEATRRILSEINNPPRIVALSANVMEESQQECDEVGMQGFVQKPFKLDDIAKVLVDVGSAVRKAS